MSLARHSTNISDNQTNETIKKTDQQHIPINFPSKKKKHIPINRSNKFFFF